MPSVRNRKQPGQIYPLRPMNRCRVNSTPGSYNAEELFRVHQQAVYQRTDKTFAILMVLQWVAGIVAALWISPQAWVGTESYIHPHVWVAIFLAGTITALPVFLA